MLRVSNADSPATQWGAAVFPHMCKIVAGCDVDQAKYAAMHRPSSSICDLAAPAFNKAIDERCRQTAEEERSTINPRASTRPSSRILDVMVHSRTSNGPRLGLLQVKVHPSPAWVAAPKFPAFASSTSISTSIRFGSANPCPTGLRRYPANDRKARRAIRARTKEHIERLERELERELEELKSKQSGDQTVQELLRLNKALEEELMRLKENMGLSLPDELLLTSIVYDDNLSTGSDAIPSPRGSPFPGDYNSFPGYSQQYVPLSNNCESWAGTVSCPVPSNISSPSSSADNYSAGYIQSAGPS
ncbi:hypothetical protein MRS44_018395 [Fusarium solani]|uniref:uncharacterized protein n=1 Tax=Fusarium solani TaxID=169388 RepID=UPI0032C42634|nr:hypothetical protein MRS44_018395 [Fusarium solani]